jgi:hypothetical protein
MPVEDLRQSAMMAHLLDTIDKGEDISHYAGTASGKIDHPGDATRLADSVCCHRYMRETARVSGPATDLTLGTLILYKDVL